MKDTKTIDRVRELMMDEGLDTDNEVLAVQITLIYLQAQSDYINKKLEA